MQADRKSLFTFMVSRKASQNSQHARASGRKAATCLVLLQEQEPEAAVGTGTNKTGPKIGKRPCNVCPIFSCPALQRLKYMQLRTYKCVNYTTYRKSGNINNAINLLLNFTWI